MNLYIQEFFCPLCSRNGRSIQTQQSSAPDLAIYDLSIVCRCHVRSPGLALEIGRDGDSAVIRAFDLSWIWHYETTHDVLHTAASYPYFKGRQ